MNLYISSFNKFLVWGAILSVVLLEAYVAYYYSPLRGISYDIRDDLNETYPDYVLTGDIHMRTDVDQNLLQEEWSSRLQRRLKAYIYADVGRNDAQSSIWYLFIKNGMATSRLRQIPIIIFFVGEAPTSPGAPSQWYEDNRLTFAPFLSDNDSVFYEKAYGIPAKKENKGLMAHYATYNERKNLAEALILQWLQRIFFYKGSSFRPDAVFANRLQGSIFMRDEAKDRSLPKPRRRSFYEGNTLPGKKEFMDLIENSFLPHIIKESERFRLVMVELPLPSVKDSPERARRKVRYREYLAEYLKSNNVIFLSLANEPAFQGETVFNDLDRLVPKAKHEAAKFIAEKLFETGVFDVARKA